MLFSIPLDKLKGWCVRSTYTRGWRFLQCAASRDPAGKHLALVVCSLLALGHLWMAAGCSESVGVPVVAGFDTPERALAEYLAEQVEAARALPESGAMRGRLAMAYHANGFVEAALESYVQAEALAPEDARWPYLRALLLAESGESDEALRSMERALRLEPSYLPGWLWRGNWLLDDDHLEAAEGIFVRVLAVLGDERYVARAGAEGVTERGEDGRRRGLAESSIAVAAQVGLARIRLREGRGSTGAGAAATLLEPLVARLGHPQAARLLAQAYRVLGREDDAQRYAAMGRDATPLAWRDERREALAQHVRGYSGTLAQGQSRIAEGRARAALDLLEPLLEDHPQDAVLLNNLAAAYGMMDDPQAVLDTLLPAIDAHPENHLLHYNIAAALADLGRTDDALRHVRRALALQPGFLQAREEEVALLVNVERYDEALAVIEAAADEGRQTAAILVSAGLIEGTRGLWPAAVGRLQEAIDLDPSHAQAHLYLAHAHIELGRLDDAREALSLAATLGASAEAVARAEAHLDEASRP